ncbi:MAG: hypothetical protein L0154_31165 [Chloroflexi bacterium]|nr:hypothetical protein [Chloroflexota bacterium]
MAGSNYHDLAESGRSPYEVYLIARKNGNCMDACQQILIDTYGLCDAEARTVIAIGSGIEALSAFHPGSNVLSVLERELCLYSEAAWFHGKYIALLSQYLNGELSLADFEERFVVCWREMQSEAVGSYAEIFDREARLADDIVAAIEDEERCQTTFTHLLQHALDTFVYLGWSGK